MEKLLKLDIEKFVLTHAEWIRDHKSLELAIKYVEEVIKDNDRQLKNVIKKLYITSVTFKIYSYNSILVSAKFLSVIY